MRHLRTERGVRALLCEGGPRLHAQLIEAGLVDELFVTHAAKLAGGTGPAWSPACRSASARSSSPGCLPSESTGELFARYRVRALTDGATIPRLIGDQPRLLRDASPRRNIRRARIVVPTGTAAAPRLTCTLSRPSRRPVDVLEFEQQRRLVEGEADAGAERNREGSLERPSLPGTSAAPPEPKASRMPGTKWCTWRPPTRTFSNGHHPVRIPQVESRTSANAPREPGEDVEQDHLAPGRRRVALDRDLDRVLGGQGGSAERVLGAFEDAGRVRSLGRPPPRHPRELAGEHRARRREREPGEPDRQPIGGEALVATKRDPEHGG